MILFKHDSITSVGYQTIQRYKEVFLVLMFDFSESLNELKKGSLILIIFKISSMNFTKTEQTVLTEL